MPAIIVQSNGSTEQDTNVILYEDVQPGALGQQPPRCPTEDTERKLN